MLSYFLIFIFLLVNTSIQIIFKTIALGPGGTSYFALMREPLFYFCGLLFFIQALIWIAVLKRMPLSKAYPFTSLAVITMILSGYIFFEESVSLGNIVGGLIIVIGVIVIAGYKKQI